MIYFERDLGRTSIGIIIEEDIYYKHKNIFDSLFFTYTTKSKLIANNNMKIIYINKSNKDFEDSDIGFYNYCYIYDFDKNNCVNELITFLEECYEKILMCTIFHGSCLMLKNKGIMLLGPSRYGKSTLTYHLIHQDSAFYLDDDVVYLFNNSFIGFNTPMCMRNKYIENKNLLEINTDIDNIPRYTYDIENNRKISKIKSINCILFPKYQSDVEFQMSEINGYALTNNIISNIKGTTDMTTTYRDISTGFTNLKAYKIKYNNCYNVSEFLKTVMV